MAVLRIALLQLASAGRDLEANRAKGIASCRAAAELGADVALFPEMWSIGYASFDAAQPDDRDAWRALAVARDDAFVAEHAALARELSIAIGVTYLEAWPGSPRNALTLFDRHGDAVLHYAKTHLCPWGPPDTGCTPGDALSVATLDTRAGPVRVGAMICFDREFPEAARVLALDGAELILVPNASDLGERAAGIGDLRLAQFRARAFESLAAVAMANYAAPQHDGHSVAFHPDGAAIVLADEGEQIVLADVDLERVRSFRAAEAGRVTARRPELYAAIAARYAIRLARADEVGCLPAIEDAAGELFAATDLASSLPDGHCAVADLAAAQRAGTLWVAVAPGGEPVGFAYARMLGGEPHLEELDVHPDHGRRGLGAKLVRALIEWARAHGAAGVTLSTFRDVEWNAPFYARLGFRALDPGELADAHRELIAIEVKKGLPVERRVMMRLGLRSSDPFYLRSQYGDATNLEARIALHRRFGTNAVGWPRWLAEQLPDFAGKRVLDVGCGSAALWRSELARLPRSASLVLCDLSPGMVRAARSALAGDARVRFASADAQRIPFRDGVFDCVLANHMLYHVADRPRAVVEIARVLAPGGTLVAATNGARHLAEIDALLRRHGAPGGALATSMLEAFTLENGGAQLAAAFGDVALRRYDDGLVVTEVEPLLAYIRSMGPLDTAVQGAIERDAAREIERAGAFRVTKDTGVFVARR